MVFLGCYCCYIIHSAVVTIMKSLYGCWCSVWTRFLLLFRFYPMSWLTSLEPPPVKLPIKTFEEILQSPELSMAASPVDFVVEHMRVNSTAAQQVEMLTRGQADNPLWGVCRRGRLTASNFGPVVRCITNNRKPSQSLLNTILGRQVG